MTDQPRTQPEAVWIGRQQPTSFAMLHRPTTPTGRGVIICNTLGFEGLLAHRPFRHLAQTLTDNGHTVLRLDYQGTGDAFGTEDAPADVASLLDNIDDAVDLLRTREGCSNVSLIGIRLGATLACRYALEHPVENLVLWAPIDRGSLYVRELKALHRLSAGSRPPQGLEEDAAPDRPLEVVGFEFGLDLLDELADVNLVSELHRSPARRVLVVDRDDTAPTTDLLDALRATGTVADHDVIGGWPQFMVSDETQSEMPSAALQAITAWMCPGPDAAARAATLDLRRRDDGARPVLPASSVSDGRVSERPVWIDGLFAIITEPAAGVASRRAVVILANTGSVNRSGPGRLYVQLARRWAALGFTVIRVDLGGTGDSAAPFGSAENRPYAPARTAELLATVDWARRNIDAHDLTLFGICSGAFHSFHAALQSSSVEHVILVNQSIFYLGSDDTVQSSTGKAVIAAHNLQRLEFVRSQLPAALRSPGDLLRFVRRAARGLTYLWAARARRFFGGVGISVREPEDLAHDLDALACRGISTLAVFAAAEPGARYLRTIGGATLARLIGGGAVTVLDIDGGDHVFSPPAARQAMADAVTRSLETVRPALSLVGSMPEEA